MKLTRRTFHLTRLSHHHRFPKSRKPIAVTVFSILAALLSLNAQLRAQGKPDKDYLFYVLSEGADKISLVRFGPGGIRVERDLQTGDMPVDIDGPHGLAISPDKQFYFVSL